MAEEFQTEDELDAIAMVPEGSNDLSAMAMFKEREYYKENIYPKFGEVLVPLPFDLWYDRSLFGKLDPGGDPIFPTQFHMNQATNADSNVWVFDFVADAFNDFKTEFLFVNKKSVIGTPFELLKPQRGWVSTVVAYDKYMDLVYNKFTNFIRANNKDSEIVSFDKFMNIFYDFASDSSLILPITLSQYIVSPNCSPATSGLMLDISLDFHGYDVDKYHHFINDPNFICYASTAQKFGFKIDKNFPGRLIADINSPVMTRDGDPSISPSQGGQGYMRRYPKKPSVFDRKPPAEPQLTLPRRPDAQPQNPFEVGDKISFLVSRKATANAAAPDGEWIILRDYSNLEGRAQEAGLNQKSVVKDGTQRRGLESLKTALYKLGYEAPTRIVGSIVEMPVGGATNYQYNWTQNQGNAAAPPTMIVRAKLPQAGITRRGCFGPHCRVWHGMSFEDLLAENFMPRDDGYLYGSAKVRRGAGWFDLRFEIPTDAVHLAADAGPFTVERFVDRASYPARLRKYNEDRTEAQRVWGLKHEEWRTQSQPAYEKALQANREAWEYYENPFNQLRANNLFYMRYRKSYMEDMLMLKEVCMQFYYSYIKNNPVATVTKLVRENGNTFLTDVKVIEREPISLNFMEQKYPTAYWIKQFMLMRNAESENKKTFAELRILRRRALEIYEQHGLLETLKYIKEKMPAQAYESEISLD